MNLKCSEAQKLKWSKIDPQVRSENGRRAALAKWAKMSVEDRRKHGILMSRAKKVKV